MRVRRRMMLIGMTMALVALSIAPSWLEQRAVALQAVGLVTEVVPCATWLQMGTDDDGCVVILHMAADAPEVDVWLDGAESGVTLAYLEDSGYLAVPAGEHEVALVPAGGDLADAVWSGALSIAGGVIYHAAASGSVADGSFGVKVWTRYGGKMPEGKAIIEFMQVGSAAGVDVAIDGETKSAGLGFNQVSDDYLVDAGAHMFGAGPSGAAEDREEVDIEAGALYSVYVTPDDNGIYVVETNPNSPVELKGKFGGPIADFIAAYGEPDSEQSDVYTWDEVDAFGAEMTVIVAKKKVVSVTLSYGETGAPTDADVAEHLAAIMPDDVDCDDTSVSSDYGDDVYECHSVVLERAISTEAMNNDLEAAGKRGDLSWTLDAPKTGGTEITIRFGHDVFVPPTPTPKPTATKAPTATRVPPTPTMTAQQRLDQQRARYTQLGDARDLEVGRVGRGDMISFSGTVQNLGIADAGYGFNLGTNSELFVPVSLQIQISGTDVWVIVGYDGDVPGVYEGTWITVYGTVRGTECFTNRLGGQVCQPLIEADFVEY